MVKKITALIICIASILGVTPAFAENGYYAYRDLQKIDQNELVYQETDVSELDEIVRKINNLIINKGNEERIKNLLEYAYTIYYDVQNSYVLAQLSYDRNYNEENIERLNNASKATLKATELLRTLFCEVYESRYKSILIDGLGDTEAALYFELSKNDETESLLEKELELTNKYSELYGDYDACAELFVELVKVRNEIAKKSGYENYADYANDIIYGRKYTDEEIDEFTKTAVECFLPIYSKAVTTLGQTEGKPISMNEDDVLLNTRAVVKKINPELGETFDYMIANNLYDISVSDKKNPSAGAYTVVLPKPDIPFIFINPTTDFEQDGVDTVHTLMHEFGHFSAMLYEPETNNFYAEQCIETAEIHSQGLELLAEHYYGRLFGDSAPYERYFALYKITASILDGCFLNEWQTAVYNLENPTVENINAVAVEIMRKYYGIEYHTEDAQAEWTCIPHNYTLPMYYISYALSGMAALDLYTESINDYEGAVDRYMRISAAGTYKPFDELIDDGSIDNIYDDETIRRIANSIEGVFALDYTDVSQEAWYLPYIYTVSNIMHGRAENSFMPDIPITRSEFVGTIGRMYDYYVGIGKDYENTFSDIGGGDENVRYIAWAEANEIVSGYDDDTFGGNDPLTREQAAAIIFRLTETPKDGEGNISVFTDCDEISEWAREATAWAHKNAIIDGRDNGEFDPKENITRAETAKIVSCYIKSEY